MAVPCERTRMFSSELASDRARTAYRVAGIIRDADATAMSEDMVEATVELKVCSWRLLPPAMKQQPRTRRMFDRILPSILDCTIRISPCRRATMETCEAIIRMCVKMITEWLSTYNQLHGVSKGRIKQASDRLAQLDTQLFSREAEEGGQGNDGEKIDNEGGRWVNIQRAEHYANRHKDQQHVDVVAREHQPRGVQERCGPSNPCSVVLV